MLPKTFFAILFGFAAAWSGTAAAQTLPSLSATPTSLSFVQVVGATQLPPAQTVAVKSSPSAALDLTVTVNPAAPWLIVTPASLTTPAALTVRVNPTSVSAGVHTTNIVLASAGAGNSPITVPVTLAVKNPPPTLAAAPASLTFNYTTDQKTAVADQNLALTTSGEPVQFAAAVSGAVVGGITWLSLAPGSGIALAGSPAAIDVSAKPAGMLPGTYSAKITITSTNAANKSLTVPVTLVITPGTAVLASVWPPDIAVGSPDTTITLSGAQLFPNSVVHVGTVAVSTTWIGTTVLLAVVPASLLSAQGTLSITVTNAPQPASNALNWVVTPPGPRIWAVTNGASFASASPTPNIAPGEIVSIFGSGLGPANLIVAAPSGGAYPTSLGTAPASTSVEFETSAGVWTAMPVLFAQANQVNAVTPFNMTPAAGMAVRVTYNGVTSQPFTVNGVAADPGVFTVDASGAGQAAVLNYNAATLSYSQNASTNPAPRGSTILIYATGGGQTNPLPTPEGQVLGMGNGPVLTGSTTVTIGADTVMPAYAGGVPGSIAGLVQINVVVPNTAVPGKAVPVLISIGGNTSQAGATIAVK